MEAAVFLPASPECYGFRRALPRLYTVLLLSHSRHIVNKHTNRKYIEIVKSGVGE